MVANALKKTVIVVVVAMVAILAPVGTSVSVWALDAKDYGRYSENRIYFYNPAQRVCNTIASGDSISEATASDGLSSLQAGFADKYHDIAQELSVQYGIPWETVVAQGILESESGTSNFAVNRNNFHGIGAYDSNPDKAFTYSSPEEGWKGYYNNIVKTATYRAHGVFQGDTITDPYAYLKAIKAAGYATDENYIKKVSALIAALENRSSEKNWMSSAELAQKYPEMITNAGVYADGGAVAVDGDNSLIYDECYDPDLGVNVKGNGNIGAVALALSWPDRTHAPDDPKPIYALALQETGVGNHSDICVQGGNSCDAFLATVMRYSGADDGFPCCGAASQRNYMASRKDMYVEIPNDGNTANLQPGDIRASNGHVEIVVQVDGTFKIASASHCDRTADHYINYYADSQYTIFRRIDG